jgi:hypothetical protein
MQLNLRRSGPTSAHYWAANYWQDKTCSRVGCASPSDESHIVWIPWTELGFEQFRFLGRGAFIYKIRLEVVGLGVDDRKEHHSGIRKRSCGHFPVRKVIVADYHPLYFLSANR